MVSLSSANSSNCSNFKFSSDEGSNEITQTSIVIKDIKATFEPSLFECIVRIMSKQPLGSTRNGSAALNILVADHTAFIQCALFGEFAANKNAELYPGVIAKLRFNEKKIILHKSPKYNNGDLKWSVSGITIIEVISPKSKDAKLLKMVKFDFIKLADLAECGKKKVNICGIITGIVDKTFVQSNGYLVKLSDFTSSIEYCAFVEEKFKHKIGEVICIKSAELISSVRFGISLKFGVIFAEKKILKCLVNEYPQELKNGFKNNELSDGNLSTDGTINKKKFTFCSIAKFNNVRDHYYKTNEFKSKYNKVKINGEVSNFGDIHKMYYYSKKGDKKSLLKEEVLKIKKNKIQFNWKPNLVISGESSEENLNVVLFGKAADNLMKCSVKKWKKMNHKDRQKYVEKIYGKKITIYIICEKSKNNNGKIDLIVPLVEYQTEKEEEDVSDDE